MSTKICTKCKQEKSLEGFYRNKNKKDGRGGWCKVCAEVYRRAYMRLEANKAHRKKYNQEYRKSEISKVAKRQYWRSDKGRVVQRRLSRQFRIDNPHVKAAQSTLNNAVRDGKIERDPCEVCGIKVDVHGHHEDYSKPLDVNWLCHQHHMDLHRRKNQAQGGR